MISDPMEVPFVAAEAHALAAEFALAEVTRARDAIMLELNRKSDEARAYWGERDAALARVAALEGALVTVLAVMRHLAGRVDDKSMNEIQRLEDAEATARAVLGGRP